MAKTERTFSIILPKFDNEGHRIDTNESKRVGLHMSDHFGGVTVFPSVLGCVDNNGNLQCESNIMLTSARNSTEESQFNKDRDFMFKLAKRTGIRLGQEAIMVEEDVIQDVEFISGERRQAVPKKLRETDIFKKVIGD